MPLDVNTAREYFANVIRKGFPIARVDYKEGAVPNATAFFFSWPLPDQNRNSLTITVMFYAAAMNAFIAASAEVRGAMSERFLRIIHNKVDEGYDPEDQSLESFKVHIYEQDLD